MSYRTATFAAAMCVALAGPVAAACASATSIKAVIASYGPKIDVAEGHVLTALGEYKTGGDPAVVEAAIGDSVSVLSSLKAKVARQSASTPRVRKARTKVENGLQAVIVGYGDLSNAYAEKAASPEGAAAEAKSAVVMVSIGRKKLREGVKLLS